MDKRIEEWKDSYRKANNQEPVEVVYIGHGWWRIGESKQCYRAKDFERFTANLKGVPSTDRNYKESK